MLFKFNCVECGLEKEVNVKVPTTCSSVCRGLLMGKKLKAKKENVKPQQTTGDNQVSPSQGTEGSIAV